MFVTSGPEVLLPSASDFLDQLLSSPKPALFDASIVRHLDSWLKPELCLTVGAMHVHVYSRLFAREEVETKSGLARIKSRLQSTQPATNIDAVLRQLAAQLQHRTTPAPLRWIRAQVGQTLRLISVDDIDYLRSDAKYTRIAWRGDASRPTDALIGTALKDLLAQLDPGHLAQVHRSVVVNLRAIDHISRGENETASIHLKARKEVLPVSRKYLHQFRQM